MRVDEADAAPHQLVPFEKYQRLGVSRDSCRRKMSQQLEQLRAVLQIAARNLTPDEWMDAHSACFQRIDEPGISTAQVLHPH